MKKYKISCLLLIMVILLSGCGKKNQDINLLGKLSYKKLDDFTKNIEFSSDDTHIYELLDKSGYIDCNILMSYFPKNDYTDKELFEESATTVSTYNEKIKNKKFNGNKWTYATHKATLGTGKDKVDIYYYDYGISNKDDYYIIEAISYNNSDKCRDSIKSLMKSTKFSK